MMSVTIDFHTLGSGVPVREIGIAWASKTLQIPLKLAFITAHITDEQVCFFVASQNA